MEVHAMKSITQDNHHTKCFFGKINAVFSAVSYRQNLARRQCQQNQRNSSYADFPASCQHRIPAQVSLHADESTSGHAGVRQGYVLPFHELLLYKLTQVHYTPSGITTICLIGSEKLFTK